uniref:Uncharacterized protein n=1 Tax=Cacopsylla melanoneura TaxID=428564 RepID=A0A8D8U9H1_9HEMI
MLVPTQWSLATLWEKNNCKLQWRLKPVLLLIPPACTVAPMREPNTWTADNMWNPLTILRRYPSPSQCLCNPCRSLPLYKKDKTFTWSVIWNPWETPPCAWNGSRTVDQ